MKKILSFVICALFLIGTVLFLNIFVIEHELELKLIDEVSYNSSESYGLSNMYFFIKDEDYANMYDGKEILQGYATNYDLSKLDTENHTYFVLLNGKDPTVTYDGSHCLLRGTLGIPEEYAARIELTKTTESKLRIYEVKKINIDFDYHGGENMRDY